MEDGKNAPACPTIRTTNDLAIPIESLIETHAKQNEKKNQI